jgi:Mg2+ and Co2+ transporter CorA
MIQIFYVKNGNEPPISPPLDQVPVLLKDPEALIWVNMAETNAEEMQSVLSDTFHFHPLTIEDCQSSGYQDAKLDDYQEFLFLVVNAIDPKTSFQSLSTFELDIYLGENYLVTCYTDPFMPPVDCGASGRIFFVMPSWIEWWMIICQCSTKWKTRSSGSKMKWYPIPNRLPWNVF